jgi:glycosyltransferase involved in cell wall biosynthesis
MSEQSVELSLILPVCDGVDWIEENLRTVVRCLEEGLQSFEVIAVCDGDNDSGWLAAMRVASDDDRVQVFHYPQNQGKGFALSFGVAQATGRLIGWLDSDLDVAPEAIVRACRCFDDARIDAAIASKRHPDSKIEYHPVRRLYSAGYQLLSRVLFGLTARDTQVGAKVFRREMMDIVNPLLLAKRYAFDLEVLAVGAQFGFDRVIEVPVQFRHGFGSSSIDWRGVWVMMLDTLAIAYRIHIRHWYARRFASLERARSARGESGRSADRRTATWV